MRFFDGQLHPLALREGDLSDLRFFGVVGALAPATDAVATATREALRRGWDALAPGATRKLARAGLAGYAAVGIHPRRIPWRGLEALLAELPAGHRVLAYSRPGAADAPGAEYDVAGRIDLAVLEQANLPADADYYLCGPDAFMRAVEAALAARGVAPDRIATEAFGAVAVHASGIVSTGERSPHPPAGPPGTGPTVTFVRSNLAVPWDDRYPSLLDLADACDVPVGFGCRTGVCHNCESGLLSGTVTYSPEPLEPPEGDRILVCCSRPESELTLDL
jgi:ferredoxin